MHKLLKTIPIILGGLILTLTLAVSVLSVTNKDFSFKSKTKAASGEVKLAITPSHLTLNIGEKSTLGVTLETNEHLIQGVDLKIKYDPILLEIDKNSIVTSPVLEKVLVKKVEPGIIYFSAVTREPKTVNTILISLPLMTKSQGTSKVEFIPPTLVLENETVKNILDKTESAEITIK